MQLTTIRSIIVLALTWAVLGCVSSAANPSCPSCNKESIKLGKWSESELNSVIYDSSKLDSEAAKIRYLSNQLLDTPYLEHTLIGSADTPEVFTINLEGMDCFTYLDYVESMRLSSSFPESKQVLKKIRYRDGKVEFTKRNHFFTDWAVYNSDKVIDITSNISSKNAVRVKKNLNRKADGTVYLPGIPVEAREISYVPTSAIDAELLKSLKTGDYVGIYTDLQGLDVSHTGIIVKKNDEIFIRHASSRKINRRVVDENFENYIQNKPGFIVLRPIGTSNKR